MNKASLEYLAKRLEALAQGNFCDAAVLLRQVMASTSPALQKPEAQHAFYHALWDYVALAWDREEYDPAHEQEVLALEWQMAGRVLSYRLAHGWLRRSESGPSEFRSIHEFL